MPPLPQEIERRWWDGEPIPGVVFALNDAVKITSGPLRGQGAAVISLKTIDPEPVYNVELGSDGSDHAVAQSCLEKFDEP